MPYYDVHLLNTNIVIDTFKTIKKRYCGSWNKLFLLNHRENILRKFGILFRELILPQCIPSHSNSHLRYPIGEQNSHARCGKDDAHHMGM